MLVLPNELIQLILRHCNAHDLYSLSQCSRQLHYLSLPVFLSRVGVPDALTLSSRKDGLTLLPSRNSTKALQGLGGALFLSSLERFRYTFDEPNGSYFVNCWRLKHFIERLTYVGGLALDLTKVDAWRYFKPAALTLDWSSSLIWMTLDMAIQRRCKYINITGWTASNLSNQGQVETPPEGKFKAAVQRIVSNVRRNMYRTAKKTELKHMHIQSVNVVESTRMVRWTSRTLNTSPLTMLSIFHVTTANAKWTAFLDQLSLSNLYDFHLEGTNLEFNTLFSFIRRHPSIRFLHLISAYSFADTDRVPSDALPNLKTLSISFECLNHLFGGVWTPPKLKMVNISNLLALSGDPFDLDDHERLLEDSVACRLKKYKLCLTLHAFQPSVNWKLSSSPAPSDNPLSKNVTELRISVGRKFVQYPIKWTFTRKYKVIKFAGGTPGIRMFARWLNSFPALRELMVINLRLGVLDKEAFELGVRSGHRRLEKATFDQEVIHFPRSKHSSV